MLALLLLFAAGVAFATAVPRRPEIPDEPEPDQEDSPYPILTVAWIPPSAIEPDEPDAPDGPSRPAGTPTGQTTADGRPMLDPGRTVAGPKKPITLTRDGKGDVDVVPLRNPPENFTTMRLAELPTTPARVRVYACVTIDRTIGPEHQATDPGTGVPCWRWKTGSRVTTAAPVSMQKRGGAWIFRGRAQFLAEAQWDGKGNLRPVQWWDDLGGAWSPDEREKCTGLPRFDAAEIWYLDTDIPPKDQRDYVETRREWRVQRVAPRLELVVVRGEPGPGKSDRFLELRVTCPELPIYLRGGPCEHPEPAGAKWEFAFRARLEVPR